MWSKTFFFFSFLSYLADVSASSELLVSPGRQLGLEVGEDSDEDIGKSASAAGSDQGDEDIGKSASAVGSDQEDVDGVERTKLVKALNAEVERRRDAEEGLEASEKNVDSLFVERELLMNITSDSYIPDLHSYIDGAMTDKLNAYIAKRGDKEDSDLEKDIEFQDGKIKKWKDYIAGFQTKANGGSGGASSGENSEVLALRAKIVADKADEDGVISEYESKKALILTEELQKKIETMLNYNPNGV